MTNMKLVLAEEIDYFYIRIDKLIFEFWLGKISIYSEKMYNKQKNKLETTQTMSFYKSNRCIKTNNLDHVLF
jgi:hypothetical protein